MAGKSNKSNGEKLVIPDAEIHPAAALFPMMTDDELDALTEDVQKHGQREPCLFFEGKLLDGRNRWLACQRLGIDPETAEEDNPAFDPVAYVLSANLHRRHLTPAQKREVIAKVLKQSPEKSNRVIGKNVGSDKNTVQAVRTELESTGEIHQLEKTTGADGKERARPGNGTEAPAKGKAKETAETLVDALFKSHLGPLARGLTRIAEMNGGEGEQFQSADAALNQLITALKEMRKGDSPGDSCPVCAGTKWVEGKFGWECKKCAAVWGEPAGDPDEDHIKTQRSKTVKTAEALLRAFDDLNHICPNRNHPEAVRVAKAAWRLGKEWK